MATECSNIGLTRCKPRFRTLYKLINENVRDLSLKTRLISRMLVPPIVITSLRPRDLPHQSDDLDALLEAFRLSALDENCRLGWIDLHGHLLRRQLHCLLRPLRSLWRQRLA